jgi:hypothetical protein
MSLSLMKRKDEGEEKKKDEGGVLGVGSASVSLSVQFPIRQ